MSNIFNFKSNFLLFSSAVPISILLLINIFRALTTHDKIGGLSTNFGNLIAAENEYISNTQTNTIDLLRNLQTTYPSNSPPFNVRYPHLVHRPSVQFADGITILIGHLHRI